MSILGWLGTAIKDWEFWDDPAGEIGDVLDMDEGRKAWEYGSRGFWPEGSATNPDGSPLLKTVGYDYGVGTPVQFGPGTAALGGGLLGALMWIINGGLIRVLGVCVGWLASSMMGPAVVGMFLVWALQRVLFPKVLRLGGRKRRSRRSRRSSRGRSRSLRGRARRPSRRFSRRLSRRRARR